MVQDVFGEFSHELNYYVEDIFNFFLFIVLEMQWIEYENGRKIVTHKHNGILDAFNA